MIESNITGDYGNENYRAMDDQTVHMPRPGTARYGRVADLNAFYTLFGVLLLLIPLHTLSVHLYLFHVIPLLAPCSAIHTLFHSQTNIPHTFSRTSNYLHPFRSSLVIRFFFPPLPSYQK